MAGTGDLELLRFLRISHGRQEQAATYGSHMATHMALGLLFLGAGRFTLGTSDSAIAAMVIAFFPRFPSNTSDNRAHLQACRHLWVLAVESRIFAAQDVDTLHLVRVPLRVVCRGAVDAAGQEQPQRIVQLTAPTLLPPLSEIISISTDTDRYWPTSIDVLRNHSHARGLLAQPVLYVKRRTGQLSYENDPDGRRGIVARTAGAGTLNADPTTTIVDNADDSMLLELVQIFSTERHHSMLLQHVCGPWTGEQYESNEGRLSRRLCANLLMTSLILDQPTLVPVRMALHLDSRRSASPQRQLLFLRDVLLARLIYGASFTRIAEDRQPLVHRSLIDRAQHEARLGAAQAFDDAAGGAVRAQLAAYFAQGVASASGQANSGFREAAHVLAAAALPEADLLRQLRELVQQAFASQHIDETTVVGLVDLTLASLRDASDVASATPVWLGQLIQLMTNTWR